MMNIKKFSSRGDNKTKNLHIFFKLKKPNRADYLFSRIKKAFNLLQNTFIQVIIFYYFASE